MKKVLFWIQVFLCSVLIHSNNYGDASETQSAQSSPAGLHVYSHAHNDYEHQHPLFDALQNRFYSVEADFWLLEGALYVSHNRQKSKEDYKGTLQALYLDPLQKRVDEKGSVHGDGLPFYLWLDIKDGRSELRKVMHNLLKQYPMLTVFSKDKVQQGKVTVILTGDARSKEAYVNEYSTRYACRDSNNYSPGDPPADLRWTWYALKWSNYVKWDGMTPMPEAEYQKLIHLVQDIHAKGRKVRFWAPPDRKEYWSLALQIGIDLINTDKLSALNQFLDHTTP